MNTERESVRRQYIITMGAGPSYWNRIFNVELLDDCLCIKDNTNILQQNLFTILTYIEMIATSRYVTICMPFALDGWYS